MYLYSLQNDKGDDEILFRINIIVIHRHIHTYVRMYVHAYIYYVYIRDETIL